jgi:hypothetical protein
MAQHAPSLASNRKTDDDGPQPMRAEAIAMRRIIAERGWWLSPLFATVPVPTASQWEARLDLAKVDHNHATRERQHRNRSQQSTAANVLAKVDAAPRHKGDRHRNYATPTVLDVTIGRTKTPATLDNLNARKAHRAKVEQVAQAQGKSPAEVDREIAVARIAELAAQKAAADAAAAAAHLTEEARKARRLEVTRAAQARYDAKIKADPVKAEERRQEKNRREAERKALQQGQEGATKYVPRPIPNPHRDPTLPTAKMLREEAIRAEAIEAEERRLLKIMKQEGRRVTSERNLHPSKK